MDWQRLSKFGEKCNYGKIYSGKLGKACNFVLKYLPYDNGNTDEMIDNEIKMQMKCSKLDLCLPLIDFELSETGATLVMRKLDCTIANLFLQYKSLAVRNLILSNVLLLIEKLHSNGFYHGDLHLNNMMVKSKCDGEVMSDTSELEFYTLQNYKYYFIDFGKSGEIGDGGYYKDCSEIGDGYYKDYSEVLDHLCELYEQDHTLNPIVEIMKIFINGLYLNKFVTKNIDKNMSVKYNDEICILKDILSKVVPGDIIEIDFEYFDSLLAALQKFHNKSYSFSTDKRYGKWRFILFGESN